MPVLFDTCRFERYARILHAGIEALRGAPEDAEATGVLRHAVEAMRAALFETIIWQTLACLDITAGGAQDSPAAAAQHWAATTAAGWCATGTSLAENKRLRRLLKDELETRGEPPGARLRLDWVAAFLWSTWQRSRGLGGRHPVDWVAAFTWTEWQPSDGLGGRNPWNTQLRTRSLYHVEHELSAQHPQQFKDS